MENRGVRKLPKGVVPLASAVRALREELFTAWWDAKDKSLRFKPSTIELTMNVTVTADAEAKAGIRWWLIESNADAHWQRAVTQTIKLSLEPILFDDQNRPLQFLIEGNDSPEPYAENEFWPELDA